METSNFLCHMPIQILTCMNFDDDQSVLGQTHQIQMLFSWIINISSPIFDNKHSIV